MNLKYFSRKILAKKFNLHCNIMAVMLKYEQILTDNYIKKRVTMPHYAKNRSFQNYLFELKPHDNFIRNYLKDNPNATILIIGCGHGDALKELRKLCPESTLYGIDIQKHQDYRDFYFFKHDIQHPLPDKLIGKCDLVISVATFQYVANKKAALLHAHSALKPEGYGFICCEALYYAPQAPDLFNNFAGEAIPPFAWETSDYHNIIMRGTQFNPAELMAKFHEHQIPTALKNFSYPIKGDETCLAEIPGFYAAETRQALYEKNFLGNTPQPQITASYSHCVFLKVVETNERGALGAGDKTHRGYRFASTTVYLRQSNLTDRALIELLSTPESYHKSLIEPDWQQKLSDDDKTYMNELNQHIPQLTAKDTKQIDKEKSLNKECASKITRDKLKGGLVEDEATSKFNYACNMFTVAGATAVALAIAANYYLH